MGTAELGKIIALAGLILVLVSSWGRQRARKQKAPSPALLRLQSWGSLVAFGLILAGLILMMAPAK